VFKMSCGVPAAAAEEGEEGEEGEEEEEEEGEEGYAQRRTSTGDKLRAGRSCTIPKFCFELPRELVTNVASQQPLRGKLIAG
jgi:hypothetical protein